MNGGKVAPKLGENRVFPRYAPEPYKMVQKGPKFFGATRRNPANRAKRPKIFRRYAPGDPPPDFPTHIRYVSPALFSNLGYRDAGSLTPRHKGAVYWR